MRLLVLPLLRILLMVELLLPLLPPQLRLVVRSGHLKLSWSLSPALPLTRLPGALLRCLPLLPLLHLRLPGRRPSKCSATLCWRLCELPGMRLHTGRAARTSCATPSCRHLQLLPSQQRLVARKATGLAPGVLVDLADLALGVQTARVAAGALPAAQRSLRRRRGQELARAQGREQGRRAVAAPAAALVGAWALPGLALHSQARIPCKHWWPSWH